MKSHDDNIEAAKGLGMLVTLGLMLIGSIALTIIVCLPAHAADFEVAVGMTKFDKTEGIFYYNNLPNDIDTRSGTFQLALADEFAGQRFRVGYQYFGRVEQRSTIHNYTSDGNCHYGQTNCGSRYEWYGHGTTQAVFLQWEPSIKLGSWRFFADVGPMLIRSRFQETHVSTPQSDNYTIDSPNDDRWKWTGFSIGIEYKNVALVYQHQPLSSSAECTFVTKADTLSLRARW